MHPTRKSAPPLLSAMLIACAAALPAVAGDAAPATPVILGGIDPGDPGTRLLALEAAGDGTGGLIAAWVETTRGAAPVLRLVRYDVNAHWAAETPAIPLSAAHTGRITLAADALGGALVAFADESGAGTTLLRVDASLQTVWRADAVAPAGVSPFALTTDRLGGAFVAWDGGPEAGGLRAQRFDDAGKPVWAPDGVAVAIAAASGSPARLSLAADHQGGLWVGAQDHALVHLAHLDPFGDADDSLLPLAAPSPDPASGAPLLIPVGARGVQMLRLLPDGAGSLIVARAIAANDESAADTGDLPVTRVPAAARLLSAVPDGAGGGTVFWIAPRESGRELLSLRWLASGAVAGPEGGRVLAASIEPSAGGVRAVAGLGLDPKGRGWLLTGGAPQPGGPVLLRPVNAPIVQNTKDVDVGNFFFNPSNVDIVAGDTVKWHFVSGTHTTTSGSCNGGNCTSSGIWASGVKSGGTFDHLFASAGSFDYFCGVHLAMMQGNVTVTGSLALTCDATATPSTGEVALVVGFNANAAGGTTPYTVAWDFGDGGSATTLTPSHTYLATGDFLASLTVTDSDGSTCNDQVTVSVTPCVPRTIADITVKSGKKVKVTVVAGVGTLFDKTDVLQIDAGAGFIDVPGAKAKKTKVKVKDATLVFPAGVPVLFRVVKANNCASAGFPTQR